MGDVAGSSMAIPSDVLDFTQPCLPPTWETGPRIPKPEAPDTGLCSRKWKLSPSRLCPSHIPSLNASSLFQSVRAMVHPFRPNAVHSVSFKLDPSFPLFPRFLFTWPRPAPGEALPEPGSNPEKQPFQAEHAAVPPRGHERPCFLPPERHGPHPERLWMGLQTLHHCPAGGGHEAGAAA